MSDAPDNDRGLDQSAMAEATNGSMTSGSMLPFCLAAVVAICMLYGGFKWWQVSRYEEALAEGASPAIAPLPLDDFTLEERGGQPFHSANMRGKVWVASYFFASCIGPCRILNGNIQELTHYPDLADVTWVSITCDPDNDSLEVLKQYADQYQADPRRWLFCRADLDYLKGVAQGMNLALFIKTHSDHLVVVDRAGKIHAMFDGTSKRECQQLRAMLHECLAEPPPTSTENGAAGAAEDVGEPAVPRAEPADSTAVEKGADSVNTSAIRKFVEPAIECCEDDLLQPTSRNGT